MFRRILFKYGGQKMMSTKVDILSQEIRSGSIAAIRHDVDAQTFEKALWKVVKTKDYDAVIKVFDEMGNDHHLITKTSTNAAMTAYGMLRKTTKVKKLFLDSPTASSDSHSVYLLLHSYCVADRLDMVEYFMNECLGKYVTQNPTDKHAATLLSQLYQTKDMNLSVSKMHSKEFQEFSDVQFHVMIQNKTVPLHVWSTLIRLYSGRNAWVQCLQILEYIESSGHYKIDSSSLLSQQQMMTDFSSTAQSSSISSGEKDDNQLAEQTASERNLDLVHDFSHLISEDSVLMQHSIVYHHAIRALCASSQYSRVLDVLASMRKRGVLPQISAIIHMLSVYTCSSPSNSMNVTYHNYGQLGEVVLSLKPDILLCVHRLGGEFSRKVVEVSGVATDYTHTANYQTAAELTTEYITVLSKVNQTAVAEQFVHFLRHEFPPLFTSKLVTPLIERYKQLGHWHRAQSLFVLLSNAPKAPVSQQNSMAFHHVAEALRGANKVGELAEFIQEDEGDISQRAVRTPSAPKVSSKTKDDADDDDKKATAIRVEESVERPSLDSKNILQKATEYVADLFPKV